MSQEARSPINFQCLCEFSKKLYHIPCRILCILVVIVQSIILDYYMVLYCGNSDSFQSSELDVNVTSVSPPHVHKCYFWFLLSIWDIIAVIVFIIAFVKSYRQLLKSRLHPANKSVTAAAVDDPKLSENIGGELPLGYVAWIVYSVGIITKIGLIFGPAYHIMHRIHTALMFGPNLLRMTLSLTSVVFFLLITTHNDAPEHSDRQMFINGLRGSVTIDLLDAVQFLDVLYVSTSHVMLSFGVYRAVIVVACVNMFMPTILLFALSRTRYGRSLIWMKRLRLLHRVAYYLLVNLPMLVLRSHIWHVHKRDVSVFLMKNILSVGMVVSEVYSGMVVIGSSTSQHNGPPADEEHEMMELKASQPSTAATPAAAAVDVTNIASSRQ